MGTYGLLRVPASRVGYAPEAQGGLPPGPRVLYVLGARTSHGRTVRTAYRGTPGEGQGMTRSKGSNSCVNRVKEGEVDEGNGLLDFDFLTGKRLQGK